MFVSIFYVLLLHVCTETAADYRADYDMDKSYSDVLFVDYVQSSRLTNELVLCAIDCDLIPGCVRFTYDSGMCNIYNSSLDPAVVDASGREARIGAKMYVATYKQDLLVNQTGTVNSA